MNAVQLVRLLADHLRGANGINAKLATIPRDGTDAVPLPLLAIHDETTHLDTALARVPEASLRPCAQIALTADAEHRAAAQVTSLREFTVTVGIRLVLATAQTANGCRDLYYYIKATLESLEALHTADEVTRTRGAVYLESLEGNGVRISAPQAITEDETVGTVLTAQYRCRDQS